MKGISHFASAVAIASFFPQVVHTSAAGGFVLVTAGLGGIAPDTLDFRFARYLQAPDVRVIPDPDRPDPQAMAEQIAEAIDAAYETGAPVRAELCTVRLEGGLWRRYSVRFGDDTGEVQVRVGPPVTTSGAVFPGVDVDPALGRAPVRAPVRYDYATETQVDAFSGPVFEFRRQGSHVAAILQPWHRRWSHSLLAAALLGGLVAAVLGSWHGLVYALGSTIHILEDQLGHMGSSLFYPMARRRIPGLRLFHSSDVLPNLFVVWLSGALVVYNLDRFSPEPILEPWRYFGVAVGLPWAIILAVAWLSGRVVSRRPPGLDQARADELADEAEGIVD